ncbi:hypothetical protein H8356DRAFT_1272050 [Neocallimastix lanati (nom. inval.)]|nr:hypothetical protein H8356DRAFT_1272050 [Neocallimastix sp. JGI-2020a]
MNVQGLIKELPLLVNYGRDIDGWIEEYPILKEIQYVIEKYLNITQSEKCWTLKKIKIPNDIKISIFNVIYRRLLKNLESDFRKLVTIEDYINSIKVRRYPVNK